MPREALTQAGLNVVGLESRTKQRHFAELATRRSEQFDLDHALSHLKDIRENTLTSLDSLKERFIKSALQGKSAGIFFAASVADAASYIERAAGQHKALAINRASVISELRPLLEKTGFKLINTYLAGYASEDDPEKILNDYWQLPTVSPEAAYNSFDIQRLELFHTRKDYTAILGVTAASAEDGSIYFLQHTSNVGAMLQEASQLIIIVGLEKIVERKEDALLQTKLMGAFGLESVVLDLERPGPSEAVSQLENLTVSDSPPEIHIILLDNGRSRLARDPGFRELLRCISCRACAKHCPTHEYFCANSGGYPRRYLWSRLIGVSPALNLCTGCGMCFVQCPLDINIPRMVAEARNRANSKAHLQIVNRAFNDPWLLMRMANSAAPMTNTVLKNKLARILMEKSVGLQKEAWVPNPHGKTFDQWIRSR